MTILFRESAGASVILASMQALNPTPGLALLLALAMAPRAAAIEVLEVTVDVDKKRYSLFGASIIDAPPDFVFETLIDYDNFHVLAGGIDETRFVNNPDDDGLIGYTRIDSCILFFCRVVEKYERITATPNSEIATTVIPGKSDFLYNDTRWGLSQSGAGTRLTYAAEMEPTFWLPPLISRWAIRYKLRKTAESIGARIEYMYANGLTLDDIAD